MNRFKEYTGFRKDNEKLLSNLKKDKTAIYDYFLDTFKVLGHIELLSNTTGVDSDLEDIFDIAFPFLFENFEDLKAILEGMFNNDYKEFIKYDKIIVYYLFLEDLQLSLEDEKKNRKYIPKVGEVLQFIDNALINRRPVEGLKEEIDSMVGLIGINNPPKPMQEIMALICEEMNI